MEKQDKYGHLEFNIEQILEGRGISKNTICRELNIPRTNLNRYCKNELQRIDANLVCKLLSYLDCELGDLISYYKLIVICII